MKNFLFLALIALVSFTACDPATTESSKSPADYSAAENASYALGVNYGKNFQKDSLIVNFDKMEKAMSDVVNKGEIEMKDADMQRVLRSYFVDSIKPDNDKFSYALGYSIAKNLVQQGFEGLDLEEFNKGRKDFMAGKSTRFDLTQLDSVIGSYQKSQMEALQAKRKAEAEKAKTEGIAFLAENAKKEGVKTTASGLQYEVIKEGTGKKPKATDRVTVHYVGKLIDGTTFDSSVDRGEPATFPLNGVIKGWTEGVQLMKEGAKYRFYIPSELAYGEQGAQTIPGNSTLIFDVELIKVQDAPPAPPRPVRKK